jgi:SAM-dependent methyltransferase
VNIFKKYADYYDLLYANKDYAGEARFVLGTLGHNGGSPHSMLELGCGSGRHAVEFAIAGVAVTGVDASPEMVGRAQDCSLRMPTGLPKPSFTIGDIRDLDLGRTFDYVVSLFHVVSYQATNADLKATFAVAARHLKSGGRFLFDFWYGPAVLKDPPTVRVRRLRGADYAVTRIAEPEVFPNRNCVRVKYEITFQPDADVRSTEVREVHEMRYLFLPEICELLSGAGLRLVESGAWLSNSELSPDSWYGWALAEHDDS